MGKGKQAQRTKNNARPSNSSRSAEFLGSTAQNLVGFSTLKDVGRLCLSNLYFGDLIIMERNILKLVITYKFNRFC